MLCRDDLELSANVFRDLFNVGFVLRRQDDAADAGTMGGKDLFLDSADRENEPGQGDLAGHRRVGAHLAAGVKGGEGRSHSDARRRAVLWNSSCGNVDVNSILFYRLRIDA